MEGDGDDLRAEVENDEYLSRLQAIAAHEDLSSSEALRSILQLGTEWLGVEHGHLARIDLGTGRHVIAEVSAPHSVVSKGDSRDVSATYCRKVLGEHAVLAVNRSAAEEWDEDPAHAEFGFATYLGATVVAEGEFYGTICFVDREPRDEPIGQTDAAATKLLAQAAGEVLETHREEERAQPTDAQLRALFEHAPNMINVHDGAGNLIAPNPRLCEKTGYTTEELTGMKVWELDQAATPDDARPLWAGMEPGDRSRWEGTYQCKDGSTFPVEVDLRCIDVEGESRFIATSRDITKRRAAQEALKESEELHRETLRNITDTVLIAQDDGTLTYVCPNVDHIFGYDQQEAEAHGTISALLGGDPADDHDFEGEQELTNAEWRITDAEGTTHDLLINVRPVSIQNGTRMYTCRDVTERKQREQELEQMRERVKLTLDNTDSLIFEIDFDTGAVRRHGGFEAYFDLLSDDVPSWEDFPKRAVHPNDRDAFRRFYQQLAKGERDGGEFEYRTNPEFGCVRWIRDHVYVEENDSRRLLGLAQDITERKKMAQQLQEERDLLNRILETSPAAIGVFNTEGEFVEASGRTKEILGLERDEVTERTYNDPAWHIRGPDGGPMPDEELPFARVMATEEPVYDVEHRIAWPDGTERLLSVSGAPLHDSEGNLEGVVFHMDDITEQRAAREALREERDRFATLFHNLPTPVVHGYPDEAGRLRIQAANERFEAVFGYNEGDIQGDDLQELIVPEEENDTAAIMRKQLLGGTPVNREVRRRAADGLRDFRLQVALREGENGPAEGFAIYVDVTERKERERTLARRKALLEAQAESALDGLLAVDNDREVVFLNNRFLEIWDLPRETYGQAETGTLTEHEFLEKASDLLPNPEAFREEVEYLYDHPEKESRDLIQLTDGRWLDRYSAPIVGDGGEHFGRLWVFRDVTEQRQMMQRLLEVQEEERRRIDQEIHDEMGGLLTSIQFTVGLARQAAEDEEPPTEHLDQLEELVDDLATVSRTISRKLYPSELSKQGLAEGIPSLINEMRDERDLEIDLYSEIDPGERFSVLIERTVYWIVQETLMSVARHDDVGATQVIVSKRGKQLYLHVFGEATISLSAQGKEDSFRLEAIQRRVEWLDGEIRIDPIPDEGTRLSVTLPAQLPFPTD